MKLKKYQNRDDEMENKMTLGLIGNQNCGKTTLFNALTGSNQHVGNFPGVTVEKKEGEIKKQKGITVVDLPGIYSLSPYTSEEVVTRDFLIHGKPDAVINIVDATNIERNLYLTLQVIELKIPMVLALNMMDEVEASGNYIDILKLENELGIPAIPISASKNDGIQELVDRTIRTAREKRLPARLDFCSGAVHRAIHTVAHLVEEKAQAVDIPVRFAATKLVEGDEPMIQTLNLSETELDIIGHITDDMEKNLDTDREAAMADMRYQYIQNLCEKTVVKHNETKEQQRSVKIDNVLTHKFLALPIFLGVMLTVFWLTFGVIGRFFSDILSNAIDGLSMLVSDMLSAADVSVWIRSLVIDGIFAGVGSVLSFLPTIIVLFYFLSMLEDSGYMARVAFVMDKLLRKIGLSGRSFVPMLIGFGCSVPAILATRTLSSERDRKMTILLTPFMSCSAKLPVYAVFTAAFFPKNGAIVMMILYVTGMLVGILSGLLFKNTIFKGKPVPFVMELPAYRMPSGRSVVLHMWDKAKDFMQRAFTIIFLASIVIWVLQNFDIRFNIVENNANSMLAGIGRIIAPVFGPLGFSDWKAATALVTGLTAKEAVISTFAVLTTVESGSVATALTQMFSPLTAFSFLIFTLLYMPCVATLAVMKRELGSMKSAALAMLYQTGVAWITAFVVYNIGRIFI